jgi:phosphoglycolate phosphatase
MTTAPPPAPGQPAPLAVSSVLFDLDGTLTDPRSGITRSVQYALERLGRPVPDENDLLWVIGPPLRQSFVTLLRSETEADEGLRLYRERYAPTGQFENTVIPGIPALLDALRGDGIRLYVATSKPRVFALSILSHFGLADRFEAIHGSELDGTRADKGDLLAFIVATEGIDASASVMIGDREHDAIGARAVGMPAIGVRWGYGCDRELLDAGVIALVDRPADIGALVRALVPSGPLG